MQFVRFILVLASRSDFNLISRISYIFIKQLTRPVARGRGVRPLLYPRLPKKRKGGQNALIFDPQIWYFGTAVLLLKISHSHPWILYKSLIFFLSKFSGRRHPLCRQHHLPADVKWAAFGVWGIGCDLILWIYFIFFFLINFYLSFKLYISFLVTILYHLLIFFSCYIFVISFFPYLDGTFDWHFFFEISVQR